MYLNRLFMLKILNIILVIWFIYELDLYNTDSEIVVELNNITDYYDITLPLKLDNSLLEATRLNELLSKPQYECHNKRNVGGHSDSYILCYDGRFHIVDYTFGKTLLITGLSNVLGVFESEHNTTRWEVFIPPDDPVLDEFKTDVEVSYIPEIAEDGYFPLGVIINSIQEQKYAVVKLEMYSENFDNQQLEKSPLLVENIVKYLTTDQLLLDIRIENSNATDVIPLWTQLIYSLFFKYSYALIGSLSNGGCGRQLSHCIYRASFVKTVNASSPPVFGIGSPTEEHLRLIRYLENVTFTNNCSKIIDMEDDAPPICTDYEEFTECSFLYLRYRLLDSKKYYKLDKLIQSCNLQLYHPGKPNYDQQKNIEIHPLKMRNGEHTVLDSIHPFKEITELFFKSALRRKFLLMDLNGAEFDFLKITPDICQTLKHFRQVSFRIVVFHGEENSNYSKMYFNFLKLENCGFSKTFSKSINLSTFFVNYKRDSGF